MGLQVKQGETITVSVQGGDEQKIADQIRGIFEAGTALSFFVCGCGRVGMGNILIQMAEIKDLSPSERHVVDYILEHYQEVCSMGIVELGEKTFTSTTTVKRLCRKLGVDSYTDFRLRLSAAQDNFMHQDILNSDQASVNRYDSVAEILEKVSHQNASSILEASRIVDSAVLEQVVKLMATAQRIDFYGVGPSNMVLKMPSSSVCA